MAKAQKSNEQKKQYTSEQLNDMLNNLHLTGEQQELSEDEIFEHLEALGSEDFEELNGAYWKPEIGKTYNFIFTGTGSYVNKEQKTVPTVKLKDREGNNFIAAQKVLYDSLKNVQSIPCVVRIVCNGKKKAAQGEYFDLSVLVPKNAKVAVEPAADFMAPVQ